ncbi:MAG: glycosyltransferase family 4 protein [Chthoniobacteraceae bacterium]
MKITIVQGAFLPVPPLRGGAIEKIWFALGQEFARRGHTVTHLSRRFAGLPNEETIGGVRHRRIRGHDAPRSLLVLKFFDLLYSARIIPKLPPADILVTNTFWLPVLLRSARRGQLYVHVARYPRGQMRFYGHAARLQTVSQAILHAMVAEAPQLADRIRSIPLPVGPHSAPVPPVARRREILYVGRIHPEKGIHLLIEAFGRLPAASLGDWRLVIVGPAAANAGGGGEGFAAELKRLAEPLGDRVEWVGPVFDTAELDGFYARASLFIYPSIAERGETFGVAPLEAMACGCPPLVSALECFREFVEEDASGFIFNHRAADPVQALADQLALLLGTPEKLAQTGARAAVRAQDFSVERIASAYLEDFQSLCAHPQLSAA